MRAAATAPVPLVELKWLREARFQGGSAQGDALVVVATHGLSGLPRTAARAHKEGRTGRGEASVATH